jgi:hypothetical protein
MARAGTTRLANRSGNARASWILGIAILVLLAIVIFVLPEPTDSQRALIRFFMALAVGMLSYFFVGGVLLQGTVRNQQISSGGGFAMFVLVFAVFDPFASRTAVADAAPDVLREDGRIAQAQEILIENGYLKGSRTGIADSDTRDALRRFQRENGLDEDGYLGRSTEVALRAQDP